MQEEEVGDSEVQVNAIQPTVVSGNVAAEPAIIPPPYIGVANLRALDVIIPQNGKNLPPIYQTKTVLQSKEPDPKNMGPGEWSVYAHKRISQGTRYYELTRLVRETLFGAVHHALELELMPPTKSTDRPEGVLVRVNPPRQMAVKVYFHAKLREYANRTRENPWNEMAAGQFLPPHPHVMTLDDCCYDDENVYAIMEYFDGGELFEVINVENGGPTPLSEPMARSYFKQLVSGLRHCHDRGVAHRDMSLENVICKNGEQVCKIIDFGMCMRVPQDEAGRYLRVRPQGIVGKKNYTAPEVIQNMLPFNPMHADIWSLGVILFILLTSFPPMEAAAPLDPRFLMICRGQIRTLLANWGYGNLSVHVQDLLFRMLRQNPQDRLTLDDIESHPWMSMSCGVEMKR